MEEKNFVTTFLHLVSFDTCNWHFVSRKFCQYPRFVSCGITFLLGIEIEHT